MVVRLMSDLILMLVFWVLEFAFQALVVFLEHGVLGFDCFYFIDQL